MRRKWQSVADAEVARWSAMSYDQLVGALPETQVYEVEFEGRQHQVEVEIVRRAPDCVHVVISVDDGSLPASLLPCTRTFVRAK